MGGPGGASHHPRPPCAKQWRAQQTTCVAWQDGTFAKVEKAKPEEQLAVAELAIDPAREWEDEDEDEPYDEEADEAEEAEAYVEADLDATDAELEPQAKRQKPEEGAAVEEEDDEEEEEDL